MIETVSESLNQRLIHRIQLHGPITFEEWMRAALYDPSEGYYCRTDLPRWGRTGDYRTSPERSSLFGATFARYFARLYEEMGQPSQWTIVEAGSGGGHFAHGLLKTLNRYFPKVFAATRYVIDEISVNARERCREITREFAQRIEFGELGSTRIDPGVIFANELLDAFPVHRVTVNEGELKEFFVDVDAEGMFEWILKSPSTAKLQEYLDVCEIKLGEGQIAEINLAVENWFNKVASSLKTGYVVTVDYGAGAQELYPSSPDDMRYPGTLRGFRGHVMVDDVLVDPGFHDLTATVNWTFVEKLGRRLELEVVDFKPQHKFLLDEGFLSQLEIDTQHADSDAERTRLRTAAREMILPDRMASKFQVMVQRKAT